MKIKLVGSILGVLLALSILGIGTIWAQGGGTTNTPAATSCEQYMQALAQRLGVTVDRLTQASKDAAKDVIDQAVKDGKLTPERAATAKQRIDQSPAKCGFGLFDDFDDPRPERVITATRIITNGALSGATLTEVVADSPAAKAGLQVGDVILAVGGQNVDRRHPLESFLRQKKPGDTVELRIQRGSETKTINVTLGAQPNTPSVPYLGVRFAYRPDYRRDAIADDDD